MSYQRELRVCQTSDIPLGESRVFTVEERQVAVFHTADDKFLAVQDRCPHANYSLAEGFLGARTLMCKQHGWKFELANGRCVHDPAYRIRVYEVRIQDGELYLRLI